MAKTQTNGLSINMLLSRDTKGALVYQEVNDAGEAIDATQGAKIGTLYVRKTAFPGSAPKAIGVTLSVKA
jgi:hypothetical protein